MCHHPYAEDGVSCSLPKEQTLNFSLPYEKAKKICPKLRFRTDFTRLPRRSIARVWPVTKNVMALLRIPLGSSGKFLVYGHRECVLRVLRRLRDRPKSKIHQASFPKTITGAILMPRRQRNSMLLVNWTVDCQLEFMFNTAHHSSSNNESQKKHPV